jgi:hypothetical protein
VYDCQELEIEIGYGMSFTLAVGVDCMVLGGQRLYVTVESLVHGVKVEVAAARDWYARLQCKGCYYADTVGVGYCGMGRPLSLDCMDYTPVEIL